MNSKLEQFDAKMIAFFREYGDEISRFALFFVFFFFGILKVFGLSPAGPLVMTLLDNTFLGFLDAEMFTIVFGAIEMVIGMMILIPRLERLTFLVLALHLFTTLMPLWELPQETWSAPFVPTLVGQYIMKNGALLSVGILLFARLKPMVESHSFWAEEDEDNEIGQS